jgi:hypothetical protein
VQTPGLAPVDHPGHYRCGDHRQQQDQVDIHSQLSFARKLSLIG